MDLRLRRVILFTEDVVRLAQFYEARMGLEVVGREKGWVEFAAGGCNIALHHGKSEQGRRPPKLVFYAFDVAAAREALINRGVANLGPVKSAEAIDMCDGRDPDGNSIQISSR